MRSGSSQKRVLILCTGNSCRSQRAEGFVNHLLAGEWEARSAGTRPVERLHIFDDPAHAEGTDEEMRAVFRRVRDEIRQRLTDELTRWQLEREPS